MRIKYTLPAGIDKNFYSATYGIERKTIEHYLLDGFKQGYEPHPLFDTNYYIQSVGHAYRHDLPAFMHYLLIGRYHKKSPHPWFDPQYYKQANGDVRKSRMDPWSHFTRFGWKEGRNPCLDFDLNYYAEKYSVPKDINPLVHFLKNGLKQGLFYHPDHERYGVPQAPEAPSEEEWLALLPSENDKKSEAIEVTVIMPVYKGYHETLQAIYTVIKAQNKTQYELLVINDASPDPELVHALEWLEELSFITLSKNDHNLGFVKSVNRGFKKSEDRDVIILNSDTEVYNNWIDRLKSQAYSNLKIGTVTPFSNNATICSYPRFNQDNIQPLEISFEALDAHAKKVNKGKHVTIPTGVGFCMYIKRTCLNEVKGFDERRFGKGYGEENDLCMRAAEKGWSHILATDVFVRHYGAVSFGHDKHAEVTQAMRALDKLYPEYHQNIAKFIESDPIKPCRINLDAVRLNEAKGQKNILLVCHSRGAGTERHIQEKIKKYKEQGVSVFRMRPLGTSNRMYAEIYHNDVNINPNINPFHLAEDDERLVKFLNQLDITEIEVHSLVDFPRTAPDYIQGLALSLNAKLNFTIHDYFSLCPRLNLMGIDGKYCDLPPMNKCKLCLNEMDSDYGADIDLSVWRTRYEKAFNASQKIVVPNDDVSKRLKPYYPKAKFETVPHEDDFDGILAENNVVRLRNDGRLRVGLIGAISQSKGYDVLFECAKDARDRNLPIEFVVLGYTADDKKVENMGVTITGRYEEKDALNKLNDIAPDVVWMSSVWPETYSYTLSIALQAGFPIATFELGAIVDRLKKLDVPYTKLNLGQAPSDINDVLIRSQREKSGIITKEDSKSVN